LIALVPAAAVLVLGRGLPAWGFMWLLAVAVWIAFKWMMWVDAPGSSRPNTWRRLGFFLGWAGTDATPFGGADAVESPARSEWIRALLRTVLGAGLIWIGVRVAMSYGPLAAGWVGMIGTVLLLHFGLFELIALAWRRAGVGVEPIMLKPSRARSVSDFWNRWNRGFRDLAYRRVFRPLHRRVGLAGATFGVFFFSGITHDLMISLPARAGYGLPTLYFMIQFLAVMAERLPKIRALGPAAHWLITCIVVIGPLRLLFHDAFVKNVFVPFLVAIGAT
jgi:alginate O-acetyltransferase complex protein AlgI